jgi:hypothetical protein
MGRKDSEVRLLVYSNTKAWPVSAYAVIAGLTLCFAIGLHLVCSQAGESYRAVGFNDGQIDQGERIVQSIRNLVRVGGCDEYKRRELTAFVSVKTTSMYAVASDDGSLRFCEWN